MLPKATAMRQLMIIPSWSRLNFHQGVDQHTRLLRQQPIQLLLRGYSTSFPLPYLFLKAFLCLHECRRCQRYRAHDIHSLGIRALGVCASVIQQHLLARLTVNIS